LVFIENSIIFVKISQVVEWKTLEDYREKQIEIILEKDLVD